MRDRRATENNGKSKTLTSQKGVKDARTCKICDVKFTKIKTKHFCRKCGHAVCHMHSKHKARVKGHADAPKQRLCDDCYTVLSAKAKKKQQVNSTLEPEKLSLVGKMSTNEIMARFNSGMKESFQLPKESDRDTETIASSSGTLERKAAKLQLQATELNESKKQLEKKLKKVAKKKEKARQQAKQAKSRVKELRSNTSDTELEDDEVVEIALKYRATGKQLLDEKDFENAKIEFRRSLKLNKADHRAWTWLAEAFLQLEQLDEAYEACEVGMDIHETSAAFALLGKIAHAQGDHDEAIELYQKSLQVSSGMSSGDDNDGEIVTATWAVL